MTIRKISYALAFLATTCSVLFADTFNRYEFETIGTLPDPVGVAGPVAGVSNGVLIVAGGANFPEALPWRGGVKRFYSTILIARQNPDGSLAWLEASQRLPREMGYSAVAQIPAGVVSLGGETASGLVNDAFVLAFDRAGETVRIQPLPPLPEARTAASAATLGNRVYFLGGRGASGFSDEMISLDLSNPEAGWRPEPTLPKPTAYAIAVSQSDGDTDRIYLFGGRARRAGETETAFYRSVYSFCSKTAAWRDEPDMPRPLAAGTGASRGIASIFLFGGDDGEFFNADERRQEALDRETDPTKREKLFQEKIGFQENHGGFNRKILLYNTITKTWTSPFSLPETQSPRVTTVAFSWGDDLIVPSGEIRPGVRTPSINRFRVTGQTHFTTIDYGVLAVYMLLMLGVGFFFMRKEGTTGDFFLGGGRLPWWAVGISIFATTLSAITFLSMPAKAFATDWRMFFYNFGIVLVAPVIIARYLPYFRELNVETAYEYLELRFNRPTRLFASALFVVFMVARIAIVLYLPSLALNVATGSDVYFCILTMALVTIVYCTFGGMEAVVWGDVIQGFILVGGAVVSLVVLVAWSDGGACGFFQTGLEYGKFHLLDFRFDFSQPVLWVVLVGAFANNLITYSSDQTLVQRYLCGTDEKQTIRSIWCNALIAVPVTILFFLIGTALFTYYRSHPEWLDAGLRNADAIYPLFIVNGLPPGVSGLVVAAIFAAAMSTLSSNINSASASLYSDFCKLAVPDFASRYSVRLSQCFGILVGSAGTVLALFLATFDIKSLWDLFNTFLGFFTGPLGGLFLMGVFSRRINGVGAIAGLIASTGTVAWLHFHTPVSFLLYGLVGMLACYTVGYVVSLFVGGPAREIFLSNERVKE